MGQNQSLNPGGGAGDGQEKKKEEKKKYEPPPPPRTGRKKVKKGPDSNARLPAGAIASLESLGRADDQARGILLEC